MMSTLCETNTSPISKKEIICKICNKTFKRFKDLKSHSVIHLDIKPYVCNLCPEAFKHKASLKRHSLIHSGEKPFTCRICGKSFRQKGSLNEHLLTHTGEKPHSCEVCSMGFTTRSNYLRHLRKHLITKPFTCNVCGKGFNVRAYLRRHYKIHIKLGHIRTLPPDFQTSNELSNEESLEDTEAKPTSAQPAPNVFVVSANVTEVIEPGTKVYSCKICKKQFQGCNYLKTHYLSHMNKKLYTCNLCSKTFTRVSAFCKHKLTHTQERLACMICGNSFNKLETLQRHLEIHAGNLTESRDLQSKEFIEESKMYFETNVLKKRFICSVCNKTFHKEIEFMHHSLSHKNPGPFECDICCDKRQFDKLSELHEHYSRHDEVPCVCYVCNELSQTDFILSDFDDHSEYSFHKCSICHKCFHDANLLKKHYSSHKSRRPYLIKLET